MREKIDNWILSHPEDKELLESRFDLMEPIKESCWKKLKIDEYLTPVCLIRRNVPPIVIYFGITSFTRYLTKEQLKQYDDEVYFTITREEKLKRILDEK